MCSGPSKANSPECMFSDSTHPTPLIKCEDLWADSTPLPEHNGAVVGAGSPPCTKLVDRICYTERRTPDIPVVRTKLARGTSLLNSGIDPWSPPKLIGIRQAMGAIFYRILNRHWLCSENVCIAWKIENFLFSKAFKDGHPVWTDNCDIDTSHYVALAIRLVTWFGSDITRVYVLFDRRVDTMHFCHAVFKRLQDAQS